MMRKERVATDEGWKTMYCDPVDSTKERFHCLEIAQKVAYSSQRGSIHSLVVGPDVQVLWVV
jgi:hypothetical protein